jgi:hypothetical protein
MSNDLTQLTDTELDAVSGGKHHSGIVALSFGNIVTQANVIEESAAIVNMGGATGANTITQGGNSQSNTSSVTGGNPVFGSFSFSL